VSRVATEKVTINRAPVLTLWAAVVAERLGFGTDTALTLGKAVAGLNAQAKGRSLGMFRPGQTPDGEPAPTRELGEEFWIELCGREVPAKNTEEGVRAVVKDKPIDPASVRKYLDGKFGDDLAAVRDAMAELAQAYDTEDLAEVAFSLYEDFRPQVSGGRRGWGQKGELDLGLIRSMAKKGA